MGSWSDEYSIGVLLGGVGALAILSVLVRWFTRCRHPNPHYVRAVTEQNHATGELTIVHPPQYHCYECGRTWAAAPHDPAWTASPVVQKFVGYDETKAVNAATRAAIEEEQRRSLAASRGTVHARPAGVTSGSARRSRKHPTNVVDLKSRRPA